MDIPSDIFFANVAASQMDDYVHSNVLFYPIDTLAIVSAAADKGMILPQLSIGAWLETAWHLAASNLTPAQYTQFEANCAEIAQIRQKSGDAYIQKACREFKSRLDTWSWYLEDPKSGGRYAIQVHQRLKLALLLNNVPQPENEKHRLTAYDLRLRRDFKPGPFVLEPPLQAAAPTTQFWWLYGGL
ncbi:MAG: hypothetical protein KGS46_05815 [Chloroflexi bacterium]|nr:hypothetical protein [Chloroflexota bacterium]